MDGRDEAVAAAGNIGDVSGAVPSVAQRLAKAGDVHTQVCLLDDEVGPDECDEVPPGYDLSGTLDQRNEDVERPAADGDRLIVSLKASFRCIETKRPKGRDPDGMDIVGTGHETALDVSHQIFSRCATAGAPRTFSPSPGHSDRGEPGVAEPAVDCNHRLVIGAVIRIGSLVFTTFYII
jgi:hypothetical protein